MNSKITGLGSYVPSRILTNQELEKMVDTSDEWIVQRTGIRERRICADGETVADMAAAAARQALAEAGVSPEELDMIVLSTVSPDHYYPSYACRLQNALGAKNAFCFDISAACTGFIYSLDIAKRYISTGGARTVLAVAADSLSRLTDYTDRSTCVLFGDGAGACVLQASGEPGLLECFLASNSDNWGALYAKIPGFTVMNGKDVYKFAVRAMPEAIDGVLTKAGVSIDDVSWIIPHQANIRIIQSVTDRYRFDKEKVVATISEFGNTSGSSIPIAMRHLYESGRLKPGELVVLVGFGAGMTYGASLIRW